MEETRSEKAKRLALELGILFHEDFKKCRNFWEAENAFSKILLTEILPFMQRGFFVAAQKNKQKIDKSQANGGISKLANLLYRALVLPLQERSVLFWLIFVAYWRQFFRSKKRLLFWRNF